MSKFSRRIRGVALALALGAGILSSVPLTAAAQPMRHGPGGDQIINAIATLKGQLNLNTQQQGMWDAAVAAGQAARDAAKTRRQALKATVDTEIAKTTPDLGALAAAVDQMQNANISAHRDVRSKWLALYATFNPDQVAVVKAAIAKRLARLESFRERMQHRFGGG